MNRGVTLAEMVSVLAIMAVMAALAAPPIARALDRRAVRGSADRYAVIHETARHLAIARGRSVRLTLDTAAVTATLSLQRTRTAWDTMAVRPLGDANLSTTQPLVTFGPVGFALGLSNSRIVFARGAEAETLTVSRTGRLKRGLLGP